MMEDDPYADLKQHALTPEILEKLVATPRVIQKRKREFIRVPCVWAERLTEARHLATYRVALRILYRHWKERGKPFTLSNGMTAMDGVDRQRKWDALRELERLGLIKVEQRKRRSPRITVIT
jgi:hypothetical protein